MASRRKKSDGEAGGNWMDTYGDMVTLLLTFFILLYASSSFDEGKWQYILQAFTSNGEIVNPIVAPPNPDSTSDEPYVSDEIADGELPATFDQLYQYLVQMVEENNLGSSVEVEKGESNVYIKFRDNIFFGGDSDVLLGTGKTILDTIGKGLYAVDDKILVLKVCGHTAEGQYSVVDDTNLSAGRAVNVVNYLEQINALDPTKYISSGYGKSRPIAPNDTEANRAKNRRVEMIIVRKDADYSDPKVIQELLQMEYGFQTIITEDPDDTTSTADTTTTAETTAPQAETTTAN